MKTREPRRSVIIHARMRIDGAWHDVCVRNISSRGMLLQAATAPKRSTYIEIFRGTNTIVGRVVWSKDRRFGIYAQDRIDIDAVLQEPAGSPAKAKSDQAAFVERRSDERRLTTAQIEERAQRSRRVAAIFQHAMMLAGIAAAGILMVGLMHDSLSRPMQAISDSLSPAGDRGEARP